MPLDVTPLFRPLTVKGKEFRNRIVMPPMVVIRGIITPEGIEWYGSHARGGVSLVIVEATPVNRFGTELTVETLKPLVDTIHDGGALAAIQLFPVNIEFPRKERVTPNMVDRDEIEAIIARYRTAAEICARAGFDGIQPHGTHNYLINQFFSPVQNRRTDEFGGPIENRMRMALRVVEAVRPACDPDMLLLYRHMPVGEGYGIEESLILAEALVDAGVDILDLSPSSVDRPGDRAAPFKRFGVPVIATNQLDIVERALEVINEDRADFAAVGRGLIADPYWTLKVEEGRFDDIVECTKCDEKCHGHLKLGIPIGCTEWV